MKGRLLFGALLNVSQLTFSLSNVLLITVIALGVKCSEHFFEQELNLKGIGIFMSNITVITLNYSGNGRGIVAYMYF